MNDIEDADSKNADSKDAEAELAKAIEQAVKETEMMFDETPEIPKEFDTTAVMKFNIKVLKARRQKYKSAFSALKGYEGKKPRARTSNEGKKAKTEKLYRYWAQACHDKENLELNGIKTAAEMVDADNAEMTHHLKAMNAIAKRQKATTKQLKKSATDLAA
eukprot:gnl/TRDRNA2_/TRDRNA2_213089_c0_seq1.p1 gnl/TRDRNA2_/TRDRNA2_213089_c0~~gnl/TRDRNA2_/TRDRNA2_213089_c0_seq1.p1  ORF type:complete len:161 (+),score=70.24 gnl/TRDRNA2_/TRDRNA2_213089_c0_seq1:58-540(+)